MKLLSLWEPWASLVSLSKKRVETRGWSTSYRGWLAIHASKGGLGKAELREVVTDPIFWNALGFDKKIQPLNWREAFPFGKIVCIVKLDTIYRTEDMQAHPWLTEQERAFGDYSPGRFAWITTDCFRLPEPIPFKAWWKCRWKRYRRFGDSGRRSTRLDPVSRWSDYAGACGHRCMA